MNMKTMCKSLEWKEKEIVPSDINYRMIYGLYKIFPNIPERGDYLTVVDCETQNKYDCHMHTESRGIISAGLGDLWRHDDRCEKFHDGDIIGVALDSEDNHILYVCFRYRDIKRKIGKAVRARKKNY